MAKPGIAEEGASTLRTFRLSCRRVARISLCIRPEPIRSPLPHVAAHVGKTQARLAERAHRRSEQVPVLDAAMLPRIRAMPFAGDETVAPGIRVPEIFRATRRVLPLDLCRQSLPCPLRVGDGVVPRHLRDRMIIRCGRCRAAERALPRRTFDHLPAIS